MPKTIPNHPTTLGGYVLMWLRALLLRRSRTQVQQLTAAQLVREYRVNQDTLADPVRLAGSYLSIVEAESGSINVPEALRRFDGSQRPTGDTATDIHVDYARHLLVRLLPDETRAAA